MANKRLIDANALLDLLRPLEGVSVIIKKVLAIIRNCPTVGAKEVVHGRWIIDKEHLKATCSECGKILRFSDEMQIAFLHDEERFCYYCGAKMDGGNEDG